MVKQGVNSSSCLGAVMLRPSASWYHSNRYDAQSSCEHCQGIIRHERWCITRNVLVQYAYAVVLDANRLTLTDRLILHALGVTWDGPPSSEEFASQCGTGCSSEAESPHAQGR